MHLSRELLRRAALGPLPLSALLGALLCACSAGGSGRVGADGGLDAAEFTCPSGSASVQCAGTREVQCRADGSVASSRDCAAIDEVCAPTLGCATCRPGAGSCDGETTLRCRADGTGFDVAEICDAAAGLHCDLDTGLCADLCAQAIENSSYIGCEYWATTTLNSQLAPEFEYALVVANPQSIAAQITIRRGGTTIATGSVPPGGLETVALPWIPSLKGSGGGASSTLEAGGAYRIQSDIPVTLYQFNPLDFRIPRDCADETDAPDGQCFSFSNDASLLLPTHVLTGRYLVTSRASQRMVMRWTDDRTGAVLDEQEGSSPGFASVIGVEDGTRVEIRSSAHTLGTTPGGADALTPG
ncbi:MAG: IgGFc-binding protein, partial [Myxococcales bacterium]|nr:IgGFc-binding protein [Myxococcales bacterium]